MSAENPDFNHDSQGPDNTPKIEMTMGIPVEQIIKGDGTAETSLRFVGTSQEAIDKAIDVVVEEFGGRIEEPSKGASFGFTKWNSPWNPEGPKRNWGPPPDADTARNN